MKLACVLLPIYKLLALKLLTVAEVANNDVVVIFVFSIFEIVLVTAEKEAVEIRTERKLAIVEFLVIRFPIETKFVIEISPTVKEAVLILVANKLFTVRFEKLALVNVSVP